MSIISWLKYKINIYQSKNMGDKMDEAGKNTITEQKLYTLKTKGILYT